MLPKQDHTVERHRQCIRRHSGLTLAKGCLIFPTQMTTYAMEEHRSGDILFQAPKARVPEGPRTPKAKERVVSLSSPQ